MKNRYFKKEILSNRLAYADGSIVPFESSAENRGVIVLDESKTEDAKRIVELKSIAGTRGVVEIDEAQYEEIKKKPPSTKASGLSKGPKLHDQNRNPWAGHKTPPGVAPVPAAPAPDSAARVVAEPNADTAAAQDRSTDKPAAPKFIPPTKRAPRHRNPHSKK